MTRKGIAKDVAYSDWASKGKDAGFFKLLAEALRDESKEMTPWDPREPHMAHIELGRIKAIEEILFRLVDPLGARDDRTLAKMPSPTYGIKQ